MKKLLLSLSFFALLSQISFANKILVTNIDELKKANAAAVPGDSIVLKTGNWSNCKIELSCNGTANKPIVFMAEKAGKVLITDKSYLRINGSHLVIEGLNFTEGYAAQGSVWEFKLGKEVANNCRITNCAINDFNNPKRMDENYWVAFYGKNNRVDHCTFYNKKNLGVLIAVILDDERSRENNHLIDSNYFAPRPPLASNGGEIIRVGVSQHCTFYSRTIIRNNLFEHCDGEVEIISIKSCGNFIRNNVFKGCQGGLNLRHGNNNTAEGNVFLGNGKEGTGGVRIINVGNWVVNNLFYNCRGVNFRSPLAIMNGVPNSPAFRYLPVRDAVVANNTFINCTPFSLCEGSDTERSVPPANVYIFKNVFANNKDSILYHVFDKTDSIYFADNLVSKTITQKLLPGFDKDKIDTSISALQTAPLSINNAKTILPDSIAKQAGERLKNDFPKNAGFTDWGFYKDAVSKQYDKGMGVTWASFRGIRRFNKHYSDVISLPEKCANADDIYKALQSGKINIELTGRNYLFTNTINTPINFTLSTKIKTPIFFKTSKYLPALFIVPGGSIASFRKLNINATGCSTGSFISADTSGSCNHSSIKILNFEIQNLAASNFLLTPKHSISDDIMVIESSFSNNTCNLFALKDETENKGYYNVEHLKITNCTFTNNKGSIINLYRGGNDESTMGPNLDFSNNVLDNCNNDIELIKLFGVQVSSIKGNKFTNCNTGKTLISYQDKVRADHHLSNNNYINSGEVKKNQYVGE